MYQVTKRIGVAGAHRLCLPYKSGCSNLHGHNWIIHVTCKARTLNSEGMVIDFSHIKRIVMRLDHVNVNGVLSDYTNPTAENIAKWIYDQIMSPAVKISECPSREFAVTEVRVQESEGNEACYIR